MSLLFDAAHSAAAVCYLGFVDLLNLASRPLVMLNWVGGAEDPFVGHGLLSGFIVTMSFVLVCAALGGMAHCFRCNNKFVFQLRVLFLPWAVDMCLQLPTLLRAAAPTNRNGDAGGVDSGGAGAPFYPVGHTGINVVLECVGACFLLLAPITRATAYRRNFEDITTRITGVLFAVCMRFVSATFTRSWTVSMLLYGGAVIVAISSLLANTRAGRALGKVLETVIAFLDPIVKAAAAHLWLFATRVWPHIRDAVVRLYNALPWDFLQHFQQRVLAPAFRVLSPLVLPCATGTIVLATTLTGNRADLGSITGALMLFFRVMCGLAALVSTGILGVHAVSRIRRVQVDPLNERIVSALGTCCQAIVWPWNVLIRVGRIAERWVLRTCLRALEHLFWWAVKLPLLSIPAVLIFNYFFFMSSTFQSITDGGFAAMMWVLGSIGSYTTKLTSAANPFEEAADSVATMAITFATQCAAYSFVQFLLYRLHGLRDAQSGTAMTQEDLNAIAATMDDPRQCGRCGFGPVDHSGCANLVTHHGERRGRWTVSNACPRCGWLARNLHDWAPFDGEHRTPAGRAVFRQRVWGEVVVVVRAAAKALVVPFVIMRLGGALELSPSLSAFVALSYVVPWCVENYWAFQSRNRTEAYQRPPRANRLPRRRHRRRGGRGGDGGGGGGGDGGGGDCGAPAPDLGPRISASVALRNILAAYPERVFVAQGDVCSICLEDFSAEAVQISAAEPGQVASNRLRALDPSVVALRCGHALHLECAEMAVAAANARHVRCPLCREPVSLGGAVGARLFT